MSSCAISRDLQYQDRLKQCMAIDARFLLWNLTGVMTSGGSNDQESGYAETDRAMDTTRRYVSHILPWFHKASG